MRQLFGVRRRLFSLAFALVLVGVSATAQNRLRGVPALPPPDGPVVLYTAEQPRIRVVPVATGLSHPWGLAFRQNGDILVTERNTGTLRVIRNGQLDDRPIPGVPTVFAEAQRAGLMDIAVHPDDDSLVYLTYSKAVERDGEEGATVALARGRLKRRRPDRGPRHLCCQRHRPRRRRVEALVRARREALHDGWRRLPIRVNRAIRPGPEQSTSANCCG